MKLAATLLVLCVWACAGSATAETRLSSVGERSFAMIDPSRPDPLDGARRRQWMVQLFYPTTARPVTTPYAADPVFLEALVAQGYYDTPAGMLRSWATLPAPAAPDAPPLTPRPLPLILLSPGSGFARLSYSELAARLVARGYVVAVIDHPYVGLSRLPDGRLLDANKDPVQASDDSKALTPRVLEWSDDVSAVIDRLQADAGRTLAPGLRIDFARIVAAGHSVGGSVALDVCAHDRRPIACVDFEGDLFGSRAETQGVRRPALVVGSRAKGRPPVTSPPGQPEMSTRMLAALGQAGERALWYVKVTGGSHTSFSDAPWRMPQTLTRFGGELMTPERSADLYTGMLDAFARAYAPGGGGDAAFQAFLSGAPETQGRKAP